MNLRQILCPIDFSEFNEEANRHASILAASTGAELIYLHVCLPDSYQTPAAVAGQPELERHWRTKLETIQPTCPGISTRHVLEFGLAADRILHFAHEHDVDLIVIGTHGRSGLRRVLMGSVAESVIRHADCPVLAVKSAAPAGEAPDPASSASQESDS